MRQMKDSGIEWIGEIPEEWQLDKGKSIFCQRNERGNNIELQILSPSQKLGVVPQSLLEERTGHIAVKVKEETDLRAFKTIHKGDFCISLRSFQGGFEYSAYEGVVSPAYQVFYPIKSISDRFYSYIFKIQPFIDKMNSFTMTLRDGKNISFSDFGNSYIPYPPLTVQYKIADFLDDKCAKIDSLIDHEEATIEELKAYKQSVITEAVTKGLDKSVSMQDSGVEWIGKIPESWSISKIKMLADETQENAFIDGDWIESPYIEDTGIRYLTTGNIGDGVFKRQGNGFISNETFTKLQCKYAYPQDLIFSRLNEEYGRSCILPNDYDKYVIAVDNVILRTNEDKKYICYVTQCSNYHKAVFFYARGTAMKRISRTNLGNVAIPLPSIAEQQQIADYLDKKCADIDSLISIKQQKIEELKEYKKSFIYEYVTGKKEVA